MYPKSKYAFHVQTFWVVLRCPTSSSYTHLLGRPKIGTLSLVFCLICVISEFTANARPRPPAAAGVTIWEFGQGGNTAKNEEKEGDTSSLSLLRSLSLSLSLSAAILKFGSAVVSY